MKSAERYELIKQGLSEGKTKSAIAREMGVTPALISQTLKKHTVTPSVADGAAPQEVVEQQAD